MNFWGGGEVRHGVSIVREKKSGPLSFPASGDMTLPCLMMETESQCVAEKYRFAIGIDPCRCTYMHSFRIHRVTVKVERTPDSAYNERT